MGCSVRKRKINKQYKYETALSETLYYFIIPAKKKKKALFNFCCSTDNARPWNLTFHLTPSDCTFSVTSAKWFLWIHFPSLEWHIVWHPNGYLWWWTSLVFFSWVTDNTATQCRYQNASNTPSTDVICNFKIFCYWGIYVLVIPCLELTSHINQSPVQRISHL